MRSVLLAAAFLTMAPRTGWAQARADVEIEIAPGETLWELSRRFGVDEEAIRAANGLGDEGLASGRKLRIPGGLVSARAERVIVGRHEVRAGETFSSIAAIRGVTIRALRRVNPGVGDRELRPDMEIALPRGAVLTRIEAREPDRPLLTRRQRAYLERADRLGLGHVRAAAQILAGLFDPAWKRAAGRGRPPESFRWPAPRGWFVRGFGSGRHGGHLSVDIMADMGRSVIAADAGLVAYAGQGIRGYGKMVLVLHPGGWATAYAHNSALEVVAGQRIRRGERIARIGATGNARGPHVHFMWITEGGEYCDPMALFRPGGRHRDGRSIRIRPVSVRGSIPDSIRCRVRPARIDDTVAPPDEQDHDLVGEPLSPVASSGAAPAVVPVATSAPAGPPVAASPAASATP